MIPKISVQKGFFLFISTMVMFFAVLAVVTFFPGFSNKQYFNTSAIISCFVLPIFYTWVTFQLVYQQSKIETLSFRSTFRYSFITLFLGGFLSLILIFLSLNFLFPYANDAVTNGWLEWQFINTKNNPEAREMLEKSLKKNEHQSINLLNLSIFFVISSAMLFFYMILSTIFALFFKHKTH